MLEVDGGLHQREEPEALATMKNKRSPRPPAGQFKYCSPLLVAPLQTFHYGSKARVHTSSFGGRSPQYHEEEEPFYSNRRYKLSPVLVL